MEKLGWLEKWTLRYAIVGVLFLALVIIEGALMRTQLFAPQVLHSFEELLNAIRPLSEQPTSAELFYAMLTAHPIVGIYGFAYMAIIGAFYFLVPLLLKKEIRYKKLVSVNFWLQIAGVLTCWGAGFFALFSSLYTVYWPLPVAYDRIPLMGSILFGLGLVLIEINVLLFVINLFATILHKTVPPQNFWHYLGRVFGITQLIKRLKKEKDDPVESDVPVFIVAVGRGSIDTAINAVVMLTAGILLLIYGLPALLQGIMLDPAAIDALIYKNWFWWGLDMVADGNVLMYTAGTWYLLVPMLVNRKLYGENVVRSVILVDLLVSMFVWSHHLLADRAQPFGLRLISGQFVTWGEFVTMGLTIFAVMMTIWLARPVKFTAPLKFIMGSIFGFIVGCSAGLIQANLGLNVVLHNTQWVIGTHAHVNLLIGLGMLIFAVVYALVPMLTKKEIWSQKLVNYHFWFWIVGVMIMTYATGMAGIKGMLRRTLYDAGQFEPYMIAALIGGVLIGIGFLIFLINILRTLGWSTLKQLIICEKRAVKSENG